MRALLPLLLFTGCAVFEAGPDRIELITTPPGATVHLRMPGDARTMPGTTPMTIELLRNLPEPLEIRFELDGYLPFTQRIEKVKPRRPEIITRAEWQWPTDPIEVRLLQR